MCGDIGPCIGIDRVKLPAARLAGATAAPTRLGVPVTGLTQDADQVVVDFGDGSRADYDLVLGADGIHSTLRVLATGGHRRAMPGRWSGAASSRPARVEWTTCWS